MSIWDNMVNAVSIAFAEIANSARGITESVEEREVEEPAFIVTEAVDGEAEEVVAVVEEHEADFREIINDILADFEKMNGYRDQWIRENAYYRWENAGRPDGRDLEFWLAAEEEFCLAPPWQYFSMDVEKGYVAA